MKLNTQQIRALVFLMITICLGLVLGCAHEIQYYVKPGASEHDFAVDKYACAQEAQQPDSTTYVNRYGGFSDSGMRTNMALWEACMNAKGWSLQSQQASPAPGSAEDWFNKAKTMCFGSNCINPQRAIEYLNEAIRLKPDYAAAYRNRGVAYSNLKQYQSAIKDLDEAIRLKPDYAVAYNDRGVAYVFLKQYQSAIKDYDEAIRLKPNDVVMYVNRGRAYLRQGKNNLACNDLQKACALGNCERLEAAQGSGDCRSSAKRGSSEPVIAYGDGMVLDTKTNLMWAVKDNGSDINWTNAKTYCENYSGGGYTDWRMPTLNELAGLYDSAIEGNNGNHLTNLIILTGCCPWASETSGSRCANFSFYSSHRHWTPLSYAVNYRALPVRSAK